MIKSAADSRFAPLTRTPSRLFFSAARSCVDNSSSFPPAFAVFVMNFAQNGARVKFDFVAGIARLKLADIADPPDMVAHAVLRYVLPFHLFTGDFLTHGNRLQHGAIG